MGWDLVVFSGFTKTHSWSVEKIWSNVWLILHANFFFYLNLFCYYDQLYLTTHKILYSCEKNSDSLMQIGFFLFDWIDFLKRRKDSPNGPIKWIVQFIQLWDNVICIHYAVYNVNSPFEDSLHIQSVGTFVCIPVVCIYVFCHTYLQYGSWGLELKIPQWKSTSNRTKMTLTLTYSYTHIVYKWEKLHTTGDTDVPTT